MPPQFIYTMKGLGKVHPPDHQVLKDIWLSFLPGAKIGVLGLNGAGKSSLLRIMAGEDTHFLGEAFPAEGIKIGFLPQEPQARPLEGREGERRGGRRRHSRAPVPLRRPERTVRRGPFAGRDGQGARRAGARAGPDRPGRRLGDRLEDRDGDGRAALPAGRADVTSLSGGERRRVALCRLLLSAPDLLLLDEPTNHLDAESVEWLEHFLAEYPGTVVAVTHDRYFLDNVAGWILELDRGSGNSVAGQLLVVAGAEAEPSRAGGEGRDQAEAHARARARMDPHVARVRGRRRARRVSPRTSSCSPRTRRTRWTRPKIYIAPGPRLGDVVVEAKGLRKGYGDVLLMDDVTFTLPGAGSSA